jgi:SAM-dependent methyltransferase
MRHAPAQSGRPVVTGAQYVAQITARDSDRRARAAFRDLVLEILPRGATLFDFGCGTGLDACFFAERGFRVRAYDVDQAMCEFFRAHCLTWISAGRVSLEEGRYEEFLARPRGADEQVELVTSNFAPLNLIDDLPRLFAAFHALTAPGGRVLVSVLSPYFLGDLRYGWWWRNLPRLQRSGRYAVPGAQAPIVRRRIADFAAQSAPFFTLQAIFRGLPGQHLHDPGRSELRPRRPAWLGLSSCRFMFLLFAREERPVLSAPRSPPA